jgi:glycosyltransferase involved in cell wall biosynthesis
MAKEFARLGCRVVVYSGVNGIYDGVFYRTAQRFDHRRYSDVLISWRLPALFATERPNAKLTVLWAHDTYFPFRVTGHGKNEIPQEWVDRIDKVVVLSSFHESYIRDIHKNIAGKTWISRNGINQAEYLNRNVDKVPYRYFYSSDWVRGLEEILEIWPDVKEAIPEAELHVAYSIDLCSVRYVNQEWKLEEIYGRLKSMPGLVCHDRLGHQELADLQLSCEAWLYPPQQNSADGGFLETYCISALEAQAAGCVPFSRLNGALPETLKSRTTWEKDFTAKDVIRILNAIHEDWNSHNMQEMLRTNRDWALSQTWESLATEWLTEFGCDR